MQQCDGGSWAEVFACRACLATDVVLYNIYEYDMAEKYMAIAGISLSDPFPKLLCLYCVDLLRKFTNFRNRCRKAYILLAEVLHSGKHISTTHVREIHNTYKELQIPYSVSEIIVDSLGDTQEVNSDTNDTNKNNDTNINNLINTVERCECNVDEVYNDADSDDIKADDTRQCEIGPNDKDITDNGYKHSILTIGDIIDADDDKLKFIEDKWMKGEYLIENIIKNCAAKSFGENVMDIDEVNEDKLGHERKQSNDPKSADIEQLAAKYDFNVKLTKDEQLKEVDNANSTNSPTYTCELCGSSFHNRKTLDGHMKKRHDPSCKLVCKICKMTFSRRLRFLLHTNQHAVTL